MSQAAIFAPMISMFLLTYIVGILMLRSRIRAVRNGLNPGYFLVNRGAKPPAVLLQISQHYDNLFELPVLFYVVCLAFYITATVDYVALFLAWAFVACRLLHAYVHITHNRLTSRRRVFLLGAIVLFSLWIWFMVALV